MLTFHFNEYLREVPSNTVELKKVINDLELKSKYETDIFKKAEFYSKLGYFLKFIEKFEDSIFCLKEAIRIFQIEKKIEHRHIAEIRLSQTLQYQNKFENALELLNLIEKKASPKLLDFVFQHRGKVLFDQKKYSEALFEFNKALKIRNTKNDNELLASTLYAIEKVKKQL